MYIVLPSPCTSHIYITCLVVDWEINKGRGTGQWGQRVTEEAGGDQGAPFLAGGACRGQGGL